MTETATTIVVVVTLTIQKKGHSCVLSTKQLTFRAFCEQRVVQNKGRRYGAVGEWAEHMAFAQEDGV